MAPFRSSVMSVRNALFRRSQELLEQEGAAFEEASEMAKEAVSRHFRSGRRHRPG